VTDLVVISSDNLSRTITVAIDGVWYEYWFHGEVPLPTIRKIMRYSSGRAIQYLKRNSYKVDKLGKEEDIIDIGCPKAKA